MTSKKNNIFKEFWFQIILIVLAIINGILIGAGYLFYDYYRTHWVSVSYYTQRLPSKEEAYEHLCNMNLENDFMNDVKEISDNIIQKIHDKQNLHDVLREEEKKMTRSDVNYSYFEFNEINYYYNANNKYYYPLSTVDSLACIMMFNKLTKTNNIAK